MLPAAVGASTTLFDYRVKVTDVSIGPPASVEVEIMFVHFPLPD
jgi:hypothetical protein